ncbi:MAG: diaminopimelate decarboxylase [Micromonosporaceae bacterium]
MSGAAHVQGIPVTDLAQAYGTPMYLYDGDVLAGQYLGLRRALHPDVELYFSLKANPNLAVCATFQRLGAGAEVSSLAELVTARRAGMPGSRTIFLGPGKSAEELAACLSGGVALVVCESFGELDLLDRLAADRGVRPRVLLRVNPAFAVKGSGLTMGGKPRQFGIDEEQLLAEPDRLARWVNLAVVGVQAYLGTRILDERVIAENTSRILDLAERLAARLGFSLEVVDVGGGLGVAYFDGERDLDVTVLAEVVNPVFAEFRNRLPATRLAMELGRYLSALAGTYVVGVRYVKESMGERFAIADGGTNHHMAAVGIGSFVKRNFPVSVLNRSNEPATEAWNVTGPLCTPNDTLVKGALLPPLRAGDLIGVGRSGAYGPTASPVQFLSHGYPAEVLVAGGRGYLVRERDTVEDLLRRQHLDPQSLPQPVVPDLDASVPGAAPINA